MSVYNPRKRGALSERATTLLRRIVRLSDELRRPLTLADLAPNTQAQLDSLHVLADRWLVVADGRSIRLRSSGRRLLQTAFYRDRGQGVNHGRS